MPATNFMSALMLDPRAYLLNPLFCDPAALALLQQQSPFAGLPTNQHHGGGKIVGSAGHDSNSSSTNTTNINNSFRILDILESQTRSNHSSSSSGGSEKANTSGENDESLEEDVVDDQNASGRSDFKAGTLHQSGKKARKARTIFTDKQLQELETMFDKHKYLSVQDRMDLAHRMGLTDTQVKTWYQNRRTKWKRQAAVGVDLLQEPSNFAVIQNLLRTNPYWMQQYISNPAMYPFVAQRLMPNISGNLNSQQQQQQQSPSSRPPSTNNNCVNASSVTPTEVSSPATLNTTMNPFPLFFASGIGANHFGLNNSTVIASESTHSSSQSATPSMASRHADGNTSDTESKSTLKANSISPVIDQKSP